MASGMKKNNKVHKVSERALEQQREKAEEEKKRQAAMARRNETKETFKAAMFSSIGGLLTLVSLLLGVYGLISIPAIILCWIGMQKNKDYGWRGIILPLICIILNVIWIVFQIVMIFSPTIRVGFYNLVKGLAN
ncbi:MAG: hypothetical protein SOI44_02595 [Lactimicrobium sp.]|jgi:hypothetical protein|uniref:hypothetical protein n=1 Tax=Lactimicrobium sp. TaxID=2563780 RepID=UPI002F354BB2